MHIKLTNTFGNWLTNRNYKIDAVKTSNAGTAATLYTNAATFANTLPLRDRKCA